MIIRREIIPGVAHLRQRFPLCLSNIFPRDFLAAGYFGQQFDCTDLNLNDEIFARYSSVKYVAAKAFSFFPMFSYSKA